MTSKNRVDARLVLCLSVGMAVGLIGGQNGEVSVSEELSREEVGAVRPVQAADNLMAHRRLVSATYGAMSIDGHFPESATSVDESPSTLVPPQGRTPTAAAEDSGQRDGGANLRARATVSEIGATSDLQADGSRFVSYTALGEIVAQYDWMPEAFRVVDCESSWNPDAVSWDGSSYGLFQVNAIHAWRWPDFWTEWMNPSRNAEYAYELWSEQGWGIWSCW